MTSPRSVLGSGASRRRRPGGERPPKGTTSREAMRNAPMIEVAPKPATTDRRERWKWFLVVGMILVALGIAGVGVATLLELTSLLVFGPMLLVSSLFQF